MKKSYLHKWHFSWVYIDMTIVEFNAACTPNMGTNLYKDFISHSIIEQRSLDAILI